LNIPEVRVKKDFPEAPQSKRAKIEAPTSFFIIKAPETENQPKIISRKKYD
jgi:hypothetical protein